MKKVLVIVAILVAIVFSAKAEVEFAYDAGAEIVSSYIWRGMYNGGLSFQPDVEIGYDGEHTAFRFGVWANLGASDWKFQRGLPTYTNADGDEINPNTQFMKEVDLIGSFSLYGLSVGFNHYYYCDGSHFFSWKNSDLFDENGNPISSTTTEVWAGYNFEHFFGSKAGAYFNWYSMVAGGDFNYDAAGDPHRAWSSYMEVGYDLPFESIGLTVGAVVGMSPWKNPVYGNEKFAVVNVALKVNKEWELDYVTLDLFAQGSINPNGMITDKNDPDYNVFVWKAGDEKLYQQRLNGTIGLGIWF